MCVRFLWMAVLSFAMTAKAEPIGLVLSGGGAKGAYEIGVWKAICERGLDRKIEVISGTSVGGLNAALFSAVRDPSECERLWRDAVGDAYACNSNVVRNALQRSVDEMDAGISHKDEVTKSDLLAALARTALKGLSHAAESVSNATGGTNTSVGVCDSNRLRDMLQRALPLNGMPSRPVVYVTAVPKGRGGKVAFRLNGLSQEDVLERLMATTAIPTVFDAVNIDGVLYVDGSYEAHGGDNIPIDPIRKNHHGVKTIIVVYLKSRGKLTRRLDQKDFLGVKIVEIIPSKNIGRGFGGWQGVFDSSEATNDELIKLGYKDAKAVFDGSGIISLNR